jgi:branched-chain amino acid transport system ATP-binding protein
VTWLVGALAGRLAPRTPSAPLPAPVGGADTPLLEVTRLSAGYGDIRAVRDVSLSVQAGQVTALLGPNGAGKSTTVLAVAGLARTFGGSIRAQGRDLAGMSAHRRVAECRISVVQEGKHIFRRRTVDQNLRIGWWPRRHERRQQLKVALKAAYSQFPMLEEFRNVRAGLLSGGQQQMLAIASALICRPTILVLDEPSVGLAPVVVNDVLRIVGNLRDEGLGVLLVEQLVDAALSVADQVVVISAGKIAAAGSVAAVGGRDGVRQAYLGSDPRPALAAAPPTEADERGRDRAGLTRGEEPPDERDHRDAGGTDDACSR